MRDDKLVEKSDEDLMSLYQNGEYLAFQILFERHSKRLYGYFISKVNSRSRADDLLQETFLKIHRFRSKYSSQYPFLPWLFTIARNIVLDFYRSSEIRHERLSVELSDNVENSLTTVSDIPSNDLSAALGPLPESQRRAIELRYLSEWSFERIAKELSTSPENSRKLVSRGILQLRKALRGKNET